ncbi:hypothetical protein L1987_66048 [Smallanthus sonchifolius]|uniref:Uncharacterized protein n=1 Tax=Smallanthus sonchifolius TaxID=185202 RepID=A0ACB9BW73_9ASTR|nr:hypothetical protein L1987_66048 [Smallanthus sonchifolius]
MRLQWQDGVMVVHGNGDVLCMEELRKLNSKTSLNCFMGYIVYFTGNVGGRLGGDEDLPPKRTWGLVESWLGLAFPSLSTQQHSTAPVLLVCTKGSGRLVHGPLDDRCKARNWNTLIPLVPVLRLRACPSVFQAPSRLGVFKEEMKKWPAVGIIHGLPSYMMPKVPKYGVGTATLCDALLFESEGQSFLVKHQQGRKAVPGSERNEVIERIKGNATGK